MFIRRFLAVFLFFSLMMFSRLSYAASGSSALPSQKNRNQIIDGEFKCIRQHMNQNRDLIWDDVCYSSEDLNDRLSTRQKIIKSALDSLENASEPQEAVRYANQDHSDLDSFLASRPDLYEAVTSPQQPEAKRDLPSVPEKKIMMVKKNQFTFGTEISHISYKEPEFQLEEKGFMFGIYGSYAHRMDQSDTLFSSVINMYKIDGKVSYGQVDYKSDPSGTIDDIDDYMIETRAVLGYDHFLSPQTLVTPYGGVGFRYLNDDLGGKESSLGQFGYERASHYIYLPLGVDLTHQLDADWVIGGNFEFDVFLVGYQDSYLTDVDASNFPDLHNTQERGFGLRGSMKLVKTGQSCDFVVEPFVRYWHIRASDVNIGVSFAGSVSAGLEPDNNSTEFGLKLGLQY